MFHECYVVRRIGCILEYDANMPSDPVKSVKKQKTGAREQDV